MDKQKLLDMYGQMVLIRQFEERVAELHAGGYIQGLVHLYAGEEAVAVGACAALRPDDYITSTHRPHGHILAKGASAKKVMAELFGKRNGLCRGKGGTMHLTDIDRGILGANGIVGAGFPIAAGAALAAKIQGNGRAVVCFFGDGTSNSGRFHEAINMAAIWDLPVVFLCENNKYGISLSQAKHMRVSIAERAAAYGIPGRIIDGNDILAVYEAVSSAVLRARAGQGPTILEAETYRLRGHLEGDAQVYRPEEEIEAWRAKDPIRRFRQYLLHNNIAGESDLALREAESAQQVDEAVAFAMTGPYPGLDELATDVYAPAGAAGGGTGR